MMSSFVFFFQAEDGIRDGHVTGVQTCALPILRVEQRRAVCNRYYEAFAKVPGIIFQPELEDTMSNRWLTARSEERRVGKEGTCRWSRAPGKGIAERHPTRHMARVDEHEGKDRR